MTAEAIGAGQWGQAACVAVYAGSLVYAAWSDGRSLEISNRVPIILATAFVLAALLAGIEFSTFLAHLSLALALLAAGAGLFAIGIFGGADAKLLAAAGLWLEWSAAGPFLFITAMAGGGIALIVLAATRLEPLRRRLADRALPWLRANADGSQPIPYGIAIAAAGLMMLPKLSTLPPLLRDILSS